MTARAESLLARLAADGLEAGTWRNGPGDRYAAHRHGYDKVLVVEQGSIVFDLPDRREQLRLQAGDRLDLPSGTLHAGLVGDSGVTCLEAHLPAGRLGPVPAHDPGWGDRARRATGPAAAARRDETIAPGTA